MGQNVGEAIMRVGFDGAVTTEDSKETEDSLEFGEGLEQESGFISDKSRRLKLPSRCSLGRLFAVGR